MTIKFLTNISESEFKVDFQCKESPDFFFFEKFQFKITSVFVWHYLMTSKKSFWKWYVPNFQQPIWKSNQNHCSGLFLWKLRHLMRSIFISFKLTCDGRMVLSDVNTRFSLRQVLQCLLNKTSLRLVLFITILLF